MKRISLSVVFAAALIASTPAKADGLTQFALEFTGRAVFLVAKGAYVGVTSLVKAVASPSEDPKGTVTVEPIVPVPDSAAREEKAETGHSNT